MWNPFKKKQKPLILKVKLSKFVGMAEKLYANKDNFKADQNVLIHFEIDNKDIIFKIISDVPTPEISSKVIGHARATAGDAGKTDSSIKAG